MRWNASGPKVAVIGALVALIPVSVWALSDRGGDPQPLADLAPPAGVDNAAPGPRTPFDDLSETGAVRAAVHMLEMGEDVVGATPAEAADLQASIAADASRDRLRLETAARIQTLRDDLGAETDVALHVAPLAASIEAAAIELPEAGESSATVALWYVGVFTRTDQAPRSFWRTVTYDLVWEAGGWREVESSSIAGPSPATSGGTLVSDPGDLAWALAGFDDSKLMP